ncbi:magnesium transport protein CorA [Planctomycetota bacterium]|nr:magnesium transport protein CorA [Planctomycetota bacterium]
MSKSVMRGGVRSRLSHRLPAGASPGTLCSNPNAQQPVMKAVVYSDSVLQEHAPKTAAEAVALRAKGQTLWLDIAGLADLTLLREIGERFGLHRLVLEDITNSQQRAKAEDFSSCAFVVLRMANPGDQLDTEQLSFCLGNDFLITFQERSGDCFSFVRQRLADAKGKLRTSGPDYLAYALLDAIVDAYFPVLEQMGEHLNVAEDSVLASQKNVEVIGQLHEVRRDLLVLRRAMWPLREVTQQLTRGDLPRFQPETRVYLRDVQDHVVQLIDLLENYRELGASLMDVHLALVSYRINEVMKVLTIIATIFIPLTFLVGVYGMNFKGMPELEWAYGYPLCWGVIVGVALCMLIWFRRRGWL